MQLQTEPVVLLEGDGIAAVCVARLLADAGVRCMWRANARPKLAAILLGAQTQHLLREIFSADGGGAAGDLFDGFAEVRQRVVLWGDAPAPLELPHRGVVAPEEELLRRLWARVPRLMVEEDAAAEDIAWLAQTSRVGGVGAEESFGSREARFAVVELRADAAPESCWVESVAEGWLFLLARGDSTATLIAVGGAVESLLSGSRLVAAQVAGIVSHGTPVAAYPRLSGKLAGDAVIRCGSAAMSFDPLCGEGAGNAVREAFLAAAVVRAAIHGGPRQALAEHYADRLRRGFLRHLQACLQFYATGGTGAFWTGEAAPLQAGIAQMEKQLQREPAVRFRLVDRDLLEAQAV